MNHQPTATKPRVFPRLPREAKILGFLLIAGAWSSPLWMQGLQELLVAAFWYLSVALGFAVGPSVLIWVVSILRDFSRPPSGKEPHPEKWGWVSAVLIFCQLGLIVGIRTWAVVNS